MSVEAWVVECRGCKCIILACAIDPQEEHGQPKALITPIASAVVTCPCCNADYRYAGDSIMRGRPTRNTACLRKQPARENGKLDGAVVIAASIIASIKLKGQPVENTPKVAAAIGESLQLARMVAARMERGQVA